MNIIKEYNNKISEFHNAKEQNLLLIKSLLDTNKIMIHSISGRVKEEQSLKGKIIRKEYKYNNIEEITDIVGIRIITYTEDVINQVKELLENEFEILEIIDKQEDNINQFGYKSLHMIMKLKSPRTQLKEYIRIKEIIIEVQIRTILQHAWAEIEHDIGYKGTDKLPRNVKRSFARIASLLELVDIEFVKILDETNLLEQSKFEDIQDLDVIILENIIKNDLIIQKLDKMINEKRGDIGRLWDSVDLNETIERLLDLDIKTNKDLKDAMRDNEEIIINFSYKFIEHFKKEYTPIKTPYHGISVFYLLYVLLAEKFNDIQLREHFDEYGFDSGILTKAFLEGFLK